MFLYVCLILLPAAATALCDKQAVYYLAGILDTDGSGNISRPEANALFDAFDFDKNGALSLVEIKQGTDNYPQIKGSEEFLLSFLDIDKNGEITHGDIDEQFKKVDTNGDGFKSLKEYEIYLEKNC
ncbi:hypothetical protein BsWGS_07039 [Bradybaena similaris]